jgi:hypothetical protein
MADIVLALALMAALTAAAFALALARRYHAETGQGELGDEDDS